MLGLGFWDGVVLALATYLAVRVLVRLMVAQRNEVVGEYKARIAAAKARKRQERRQQAKLKQLEAMHAARAKMEAKRLRHPMRVRRPRFGFAFR